MNRLKQMIKKIPGLMYFYRKFKFKKEFNYDFNFFIRNYMYSKEDVSTIGYKILLLAHSLEKGMSCKNKRYFGSEKTIELINEFYLKDAKASELNLISPPTTCPCGD